MKLITKYLTKQILSSIFVVLLALTGLHIFILAVSQLNDVGKGSYGTLQALFYVVMQTPYQIYLMFPIVCLLGTLIGLGAMANSRELLIMRANGLSINWIAKRVMTIALGLIIIMLTVFELFIPKLIFYSKNIKQQAISGQSSMRTLHGIWLRDHSSFIHIDTVLQGGDVLGVTQFLFNKMSQLNTVRYIGRASNSQNVWHAKDVTETTVTSEKTIVAKKQSIEWQVYIDPVMLALQASEPNEMTLGELYKYWQNQRKHHQRTANYQLAFWQRLFQPFASMLMIFIAIPFIFGPLRSSTIGMKILVGIAVGFSFHVFYHFFASLVLVSQWMPILAVLGPGFLFFILGLLLVRLQR
jgi:lipopolysaccharide export system permease protein